jgi:hypothetical protein
VKFARSNNDFEQWNNSRSGIAIGLHDRCLLVPWNKGIHAAPEHETENFESTVKNFGDSMFEHMFSEYLVQFLSKWYDKINEFGTVLKQCNYLDNGSRVIWDYCLIVLNPQANPSSVVMNWAQDLAIDFLNSVFNSNIDDRESIGSAVFMEFTLMIVACRRAQKRILPKK